MKMADARQSLHALDKLQTPDVWDRAIDLEPRGELDDSGNTSGRHVVAIVVAFVVFGAAAAFAWQGFRPTTGTPAGPTNNISSTVLWPERTQSAIDAAQVTVDAGNPETAWRKDPSAVALHFTEDVLGWGPPEGRYDISLSDGPNATGLISATVQWFALPCPSPALGSLQSCPPPYEDEQIFMAQEATTGPDGIWSVTEVRATADLRLDVRSGDRVSNGDSIDGNVTFPDTAKAVMGFGAVSGIHVGTAAGCDSAEGGQPKEGHGTVLRVVLDPGAQDCGTEQGGYVLLETTAPKEGQAFVILSDPLDPSLSGPARPIFYGLTVVPVQVSFPENSSPSSP